MAEPITLRSACAAAFAAEVEDRQRVVHLLAADQVGDHAHLAGRLAEPSEACAAMVRLLVLTRAAGAAPAATPAAALRSPEWPWKVRVGANSPSLCPTMFSVTNTGTNLRPLCTAKVSPTSSGVIVERRDQVLMTFFDLLALRRRRSSSMR